MKKLLFSAAMLACSGLSIAAEKPKNIIFVVGDGMGPAYTAAYRNYMDNRKTTKVENTIFDELFVGMAKTYAIGTQKDHKHNTYVTDSAASATALSSGVKTYNQAVALDVNDKPVQTIMQLAKSKGKTTGLVVLSQINHATPASYVAHNTYRYNYNQIADSFFENRVNGQFVADLMFGGGQKYFIRKDRDLVKEFQANGYHYFDRLSQLNKITQLPVIALFDQAGLSFAIDSKEKFRLRRMTKKALSLMDKSEKGFFLLVEGSLIDWCGHSNDIACAMHEMDDFAKTLEFLKSYVEQRNDTIMVATADHNTGGLSIGADGVYAWQPQMIKDIKRSTRTTAKQIMDGEHVLKVWMDNINIKIEPDQLTGIANMRQKARQWVTAQTAKYPDADSKKLESIQSDGNEMLELYISGVIAKNTNTGWTSTGHTGGDVQVFAAGVGKSQFSGHQDNTDIAKKLINFIQ